MRPPRHLCRAQRNLRAARPVVGAAVGAVERVLAVARAVRLVPRAAPRPVEAVRALHDLADRRERGLRELDLTERNGAERNAMAACRELQRVMAARRTVALAWSRKRSDPCARRAIARSRAGEEEARPRPCGCGAAARGRSRRRRRSPSRRRPCRCARAPRRALASRRSAP